MGVTCWLAFVMCACVCVFMPCQLYPIHQVSARGHCARSKNHNASAIAILQPPIPPLASSRTICFELWKYTVLLAISRNGRVCGCIFLCARARMRKLFKCFAPSATLLATCVMTTHRGDDERRTRGGSSAHLSVSRQFSYSTRTACCIGALADETSTDRAGVDESREAMMAVRVLLFMATVCAGVFVCVCGVFGWSPSDAVGRRRNYMPTRLYYKEIEVKEYRAQHTVERKLIETDSICTLVAF